MPLTLFLTLIIGVLIKLDSRGPIFFNQIRVGKNGKKFKCYKFRTMVPNAEELKSSLQHLNEIEGPAFKIREDPRLTRLGKYLRAYSFDEFPQLFNIIKGEMSFVGPRPPTPDEVNNYKTWQKKRLEVKPGLTGLWQISGRNNIQDFDEWVNLDLKYIQEISIKNDLLIILKTVPVVLFKKGAY